MSKKKSFSRSTMTLKDFHGGSIPSDLPLPSAPGTFPKVSDRGIPERHGVGVGGRGVSSFSKGRQTLNLSSNAQRQFDDHQIRASSPYLPNPANIGRNFDEDERGGFQPRSSGDELNPKVFKVSYKETERFSLASKKDNVNGFCDSYTKTVPVISLSCNGKDTLNDRFSAEALASRFGQACTLAKVVSEKWQPQVLSVDKNHDWISYFEESHARELNGSDSEVVGKSRNQFSTVKEDIESSANLYSDNNQGNKSLSERPVHLDFDAVNCSRHDNSLGNIAPNGFSQKAKEAKISPAHNSWGNIPSNGFSEKSFAVNKSLINQSAEVQQAVSTNNSYSFSSHAEDSLSSRPKLNLLRRSKPMEAPLEPAASESKEVPGIVKAEQSNLREQEGNSLKERPKLNLKPRSLPVNLKEQASEKERNCLFGGARPRELVLKDRTGDCMSTSDGESVKAMDNSSSKIIKGIDHHDRVNAGSYADGYNGWQNTSVDANYKIPDNVARNNPSVKIDANPRVWRSGNRNVISSKNEMHEQKRNMRNENSHGRGNKREHRYDIESEATWHKSSISSIPDNLLQKSLPDPLLTYNNQTRTSENVKIVSAVDLARAFSKSSLRDIGSDAAASKQAIGNFSSHNSGRMSLPFSRLIEPNADKRPYSSSFQKQVNGYREKLLL